MEENDWSRFDSGGDFQVLNSSWILCNFVERSDRLNSWSTSTSKQDQEITKSEPLDGSLYEPKATEKLDMLTVVD